MVSFKPTFQREVIEQILTHLGLWPAPVHSPPVAGYPLPSAPQRVASRDQGVRGPRNHAVGARGHRGLPVPAPGRPSFPLTAISGAPDTPLHPRKAASREPWHPEIGPAGSAPAAEQPGRGAIVARPRKANSYHLLVTFDPKKSVR